MTPLRPLLLLLALLIAFDSAAQQPEHPFKIGLILPLTGEWAHLGQGIKNGASLAAEDLPAAERPTLIFEDNRGDLGASARIASDLINQRKVSALISIISGVAQVIKPIASSHKILSIGICSDDTVPDGEYSFVNYLTAEQGVSAYLNQLGRTAAPTHSLAIISLNESGFQRIVQLITIEAPKHKFTITTSQQFNPGTRDFRTQLLRIAGSKPETVLILGLSPEIELIARQNKELNLGLSFSSIESIGLAADKSQFENAWYIDSAYPNAAFAERYQKRFGMPISAGVGHAYDTVKMLSQAVKDPNPSSYFRQIKEFQGVLGPISVNQNGVIWSEPSVKMIVGGEVLPGK